MSTALARLQAWYLAHCDGDWEHGPGVRIGTQDNSGWRVSIPLAGTYLESAAFETIDDLASERRWMRCWTEQGRWEAAGGPLMLEEMLGVFFDWAGWNRAQAEVILTEGRPAQEVAASLIAVTLSGEDRRWVEAMCIRLASHSDLNVRRVVAVCLGHLARIHGQLNLGEAEPVLAHLAEDPDPSVSAAVEDARDDIRQFLHR